MLSQNLRKKFSGFSLVDSNGNPAGVQGLLLWNGGTVCDDSFNDNAADAICRVLGHDGHSSWRSGQIYSIQSNYDIKMDDVSCSSGAWTSCSYITNHNCGHSEDIHLVCSGPGKIDKLSTRILIRIFLKFC